MLFKINGENYIHLRKRIPDIRRITRQISVVKVLTDSFIRETPEI